MKISIKGGGKGKGWSNYVTRKYVNLSKEERSKITIFSGNTKLGDSIIKSSNYKDNSTTLVLSFKGKVPDDTARTVNEEFKELFMSGFEKSEYHYEAVLHQDTSNTHIHIRIPTKNLVTDTQLRLYYHDKHKNFINAIRDYLILKHDLPQPKQENKQVISIENKKERLIQQQRAKQGRKSFDFNKKKSREEAKKYIANYIVELHGSGLIEDFDGLKEVIRGLDVDIVNIGNDITGDFNYITVQDKETGKKIRLIGEMYNAEFWELEREDRTSKIRDNRVPRETNKRDRESLDEAEQRLKREISKREKEVRGRYESSRRRSRILQSSRYEQQVPDNTCVNTINRDNGRCDVNEVANKRTNEYNTKQSSRDTEISKRETIDDRIRATIRTRAEERENILTDNRKRTEREQRSLFEQFRESRESLYNKATKVMSKRGRTKANRRRNNAAIKEVVGKVVKLGRDVERVEKQQAGRVRELLEDFRTQIDEEVTRTFGDYYRQSDNTRQAAQKLGRAIETVIEDRKEINRVPSTRSMTF